MRAIPFCFCLAIASANASAAELTVTVSGLPDDTGLVRAALYAGPDGFGTPGHAVATVSIAPHERSICFSIADLPPGHYALMAFHDRARSGKLETNFLGLPTEAYGFSNDAQGRFGPPSFDQASFNLPLSGTAITVRLR